MNATMARKRLANMSIGESVLGFSSKGKDDVLGGGTVVGDGLRSGV